MKVAAVSNVATLQTKDDLARATALREYIEAARQEAKVLNVTWDAPYWPGVGYFVKQGHAARRGMNEEIAAQEQLDPSIVEFARAYVTERHLTNPGESKSGHAKRLQALRMLEAAALDLRGDANPLSFDLAVLDAAATLARVHLKTGGANQVGNGLERLAEVMVRNGVLPPICAEWKNPNKPPRNNSISVGGDADQVRHERLPNHCALEALAAVFNRDLDVQDKRFYRDIYTTSVVALLMGAPSRGQEIHRLPHNLIFEATDKFGKEQFGLRLHASKGFGAYVKWIWSEMVPVAETAIDRLRAISEAGRKLARHLENPKTRRHFYRHDDCPKVADNEPLTRDQVCLALGYNLNNQTTVLNKVGLSAINGAYTLQDLWDDFVLPQNKKQHPHFPYVTARDMARGAKGGLKFSDALFCMRRHELTPQWKTSPVTLWLPDLSDFNFDVGPSRTGRSIFERYGYTDANGEPLKLTSHQIRHLINTEAQRAGLTDEQIAHWSGRKNVAQNAVYDHRTTAERVDHARAAVEKVQANVSLGGTSSSVDSDVIQGQWVIKVVPRVRSAQDQTDIQPHMSGLKTLYGECHHDWSFAPCEGFVKCLDCSEHACIKGSDEDARTKLSRLETLRQSVLEEVAKAKLASEDDVDAQDWLQVQQRYAAKVDELISILQNESVPDGSVIRSAYGQHPSHLHRALRGLALKALESGTDSASVMQDLLLAIDKGLGGIGASHALLAKG